MGSSEPIDNWEDVSESEVEEKLKNLDIAKAKQQISTVDVRDADRSVSLVYIPASLRIHHIYEISLCTCMSFRIMRSIPPM